MGRFTIPELFNVSYGSVVLGIVVAALLIFVLAQKVEGAINKQPVKPFPAWTKPVAGALVAMAVAALLIGQPDNNDRWQSIAVENQAKLDQRLVQISPAELLNLMHDSKLKIIPLDVRKEQYYNQFHLQGAMHVPLDCVLDKAGEFQFELANTVVVIMSNDELEATEAWKILKAESVPNVYILEGGINKWLDTYASDDFNKNNRISLGELDQLAYRFDAATGSRHPAAEPNPNILDLNYEPKVILELKRAPVSGGCG